ncbi:MAG: CRISPR-associated endonuclease Cas2 [Candidatus Aminicenantes bacterium]|nr:CRISPR-associated endonuclease Cas2 [Candidatus Aminicenantes bacterium]NIM83714.1 CRISPR-associated endonuclease Cas2 [Candidatus Aminicenantes bacterium]NIN23139.1 CRISPR-associated endonuclease Cas2 [Candidatus Aminicenantes bacterium]NIN46866.1 CRISPR-associated endonuclease Cas2 [Candidatus Aminicenantes bacterium]NIN89788.1 CRISPR-associated endonuclease Cas2 [Candidatus Aminicenantes bacterium]
MYVILVYDISIKDHIGSRTMRNVFKKCKEYLNHIQNSVFEGELTEGQVMELKYELKDLIREDKDSIIFFTSKEEKWLNKDILGLNKNEFSNLL